MSFRLALISLILVVASIISCWRSVLHKISKLFLSIVKLLSERELLFGCGNILCLIFVFRRFFSGACANGTPDRLLHPRSSLLLLGRLGWSDELNGRFLFQYRVRIAPLRFSVCLECGKRLLAVAD